MKQPLLGIRLLALRNKKGITQKELADECNVDIRTIQRIEAGEVLPRMYTIKLLAKALNVEISEFDCNPQKASPNTTGLDKQVKWAVIAGLVFSINCIPVVFNLITNSFNPLFYGLTITIHAISCVLFSWGFYLLGKQFNNQLMAVSSLLSMVLFPLLNAMDAFKGSFFNYGMLATVFGVVCINAIVFGISLLVEANKKTHKKNYYKVAGIIGLIQTALFLSSNFTIISAGLIISVFFNFITLMILYTESKRLNNQPERNELVPAAA